MSNEEAMKAGEGERREFFRTGFGKSNLSPPTDKSTWYRLHDVSLGNGSDAHFDDADHVGVVAGWKWPDMMASVTVDHLRQVQEIVAAGEWRHSVQSQEKWVGCAVAEVMGLDWESKTDRAIINASLKAWYVTGMLVKVRRKDDHREERTFVEVGEWAT